MNNDNSSSTELPYPGQLPTEDYVFTVLLVDDQMMVAEAVRRMLANHADIRFHYCGSAEQALQTAQQVRPTVILQDLVMPDIDGLTLVAEYRADPATRDVPIIVFSTKEEPAVKSAAFKMGANDYLVKLPDPIELLARIRYHSKACINQLERERAYAALYENQRQLIAANEALRRLNNTDEVTGLRTRRYLDASLANEWKRGCRERTTLSILAIEPDDFSAFVASSGQLAGDALLRQVADVIKQNVRRPADLAARYSDGKIVLVLPNTPSHGAVGIAESIRGTVAETGIGHDSVADRKWTVSIGVVSCMPALDRQADEVIDSALSALAIAQHAGGTRIHVMQGTLTA